MTTIHVCRIDDIIVFSSVSEDECRFRCNQLVRNQAQKNLLLKRSVPEELLGKNIEGILINTLGITEEDVIKEMDNVGNVKCDERTI